MNTSTSSTLTSVVPPSPVATVEQQRILDRIAMQRERLRTRRAARAQAMGSNGTATEDTEESLALRAAGFAREHPLAVAAMAGVAVVAGPRRLIRWAGVLLPMLLRLRR
ncbi:hypothetical protein CLU85_2475 [Acidovorax sp. 69]|uniref:hypothetical protein n=1 Tax=Acidovorax sp. 69 TaxID=2035202 RepID=UPI000CABD1D1|nr:hypothetical protein CLU85_2475 [Acidovorax sp. 69]